MHNIVMPCLGLVLFAHYVLMYVMCCTANFLCALSVGWDTNTFNSQENVVL